MTPENTENFDKKVLNSTWRYSMHSSFSANEYGSGNVQ